MNVATFVFRSRTFRERPRRRLKERGARSRWHHPCLVGRVSESLARAGYDEPTVMWRMKRADGQSSHALIDPRPERAALIWFVNDRPLGFREFDDLDSALRCSNQMQAQNWAAGWRLASDDIPEEP